MRRKLVVMVMAALMILGAAPAALAGQSHPSQGENSTGRNEAGFGGGPHCHVLVVDNAQDRFDQIRVFPSHRAHEASGLTDGVFAADPDCDGIP